MTFRRYLSTALLAALISLLPLAPSHAIMGGEAVPADPGSIPPTQSAYPWNALVHFSSSQSGDDVCGATLIGARFVITGAHCLNGHTDATGMYVTVGGYNRTGGQETGQTIAVSSFIKHPDFPAEGDQVTWDAKLNLVNDIAILILSEDATRVRTPIYVTQTELEPGVTATILGWGETESETTVAELRKAQVGTVDRTTCEAAVSGSGIFNASMICAGVASGAQDTCGRDSGGPLFVIGRDGKPVQIGITSWGVGCGLPDTPGVYTNLAEMLGFLLDNLGGQSAVRLVDYALTGDQLRVAQIFDEIGPAAPEGSTLRQDYGRLFMNGVIGTATSLQSLLPTSAFEMGAVVTNFISMESFSLKARLRELREGLSGGMLDLSGLRLTNFGSGSSVDRLANLSSSSGLSGSSSAYDVTTAGNATGGSNRTDAIGGGDVNPNAGRMYSPSLYADDGESATATGSASTLRKADPSYATGNAPSVTTYDPYKTSSNAASGAASTLRNVETSYATGNEPIITTYDSYGNPVRSISTPTPYAEQGKYYSRVATGSSVPANRRTAQPEKDDEGVLSWVSDLFGSDDAAEQQPIQTTAQPQAKALSKRDLAYTQAARYPGQPLGMYTRHLANTGVSPVSTAGAAQPKAMRMALNNQYAIAGADQTNMYQWVSTEPSTPSSTVTTPQGQVPTRLGTVAVPYNRPGAINADRRWGVFMSGDVRFGNEKLLRNSGSTKIDNSAFTVGVDYRVVDKSFIGLALSYAHGSFNTGDFSDVQGDGYAISLYGTTNFLKSAYVDGFISLGYHTFDSERTLFIGNGQIRTAMAQPDAMHVSGEAEAGYDFRQDAWKFGPYAGLRLSYAAFGQYTEENAGNFNLHVHNRDDFSAIGSLGGGVSRRFVMPNSGIILPMMRVAYNHEFGDGQSNIKSEFEAAPTMTFKTEGAIRERNWMSVNPSVTAAFPNNWMFQANYEHDFFRYNVNDHIFNLAARYKW